MSVDEVKRLDGAVADANTMIGANQAASADAGTAHNTDTHSHVARAHGNM